MRLVATRLHGVSEAGWTVTEDRRQTFADKLNKLFATIRDEQGREYSPEYVVTWLRDHDGPSISTSYLYMLRRGERTNPTKAHIEAVSSFFQMPPAYFFDAEYSEKIDEQLELLAAMKDSEVRDIALRSASLHGEARRSVAAILQSMAPWASRSSGRSADQGGQDAVDDQRGPDVADSSRAHGAGTAPVGQDDDPQVEQPPASDAARRAEDEDR